MKLFSKHVAHVESDEFYECKECSRTYDAYSHLKHYSAHSGGYCDCGSDNLRHMTKKTVYTEIYVEEDMSDADVIETAHEVDDWKVYENTIRLKEKI